MQHTLHLLIRLIAFSFIVNLVAINAYSQDEWGTGGYDSGGDTNMQPPFNVYSSDSFDYAGYNSYMATLETTAMLIDANNNGTTFDEYVTYIGHGTGGSYVQYVGGGALGTLPTNNTFPYNQTSATACAINAMRNVISLLLGTAPAEGILAKKITNFLGEPATARFTDAPSVTPNDRGLSSTNRLAALNEGVKDFHLKVEPTTYYGSDGFKELMKNNPDKVFLVGTQLNPVTGDLRRSGSYIDSTGTLISSQNHMVVMQSMVSTDTNGDTVVEVRIIDSGQPESGNAKSTIVSSDQAWNSAWGNASVFLVTPQ